ncbi:hypothetical protein [uncultured Helicobacter sp.]
MAALRRDLDSKNAVYERAAERSGDLFPTSDNKFCPSKTCIK